MGDGKEARHRPGGGGRRPSSLRHPHWQPAPCPRAASTALRTASFGCAAPSGSRMLTAPAVKTHCAIAAGKPLPGEGAAAPLGREEAAAGPGRLLVPRPCLCPVRLPHPRPVPATPPPFPERSAAVAARNGATPARRSPRPSLRRPPPRPSPGSRYPARQRSAARPPPASPTAAPRPVPGPRPRGRGAANSTARSCAPGAALCKGRAGEGSGCSGREGGSGRRKRRRSRRRAVFKPDGHSGAGAERLRAAGGGGGGAAGREEVRLGRAPRSPLGGATLRCCPARRGGCQPVGAARSHGRRCHPPPGWPRAGGRRFPGGRQAGRRREREGERRRGAARPGSGAGAAPRCPSRSRGFRWRRPRRPAGGCQRSAATVRWSPRVARHRWHRATKGGRERRARRRAACDTAGFGSCACFCSLLRTGLLVGSEIIPFYSVYSIYFIPFNSALLLLLPFIPFIFPHDRLGVLWKQPGSPCRILHLCFVGVEGDGNFMPLSSRRADGIKQH